MHLARSLRIRAGIPLLITFGVAAAGVASACGGTPPAAQPTAAAPAAQATTAAAPPSVPSPQRPPLASPGASPSPGPAGQAAVSTEPGQEYEVKSGDTLLTISQQFYGDVTVWRRIYDANRDVIGADPDKLSLGMKLKIPPPPSPAPG